MKYRPGKDNPSDFMSRHPLAVTEKRHHDTAEEYINFVMQHAAQKSITLEEIKLQTKVDVTLQTAIKYIRNGGWHQA